MTGHFGSVFIRVQERIQQYIWYMTKENNGNRIKAI